MRGIEPKNKTNVVSIFTAKKAKCLWCCDILRIPGWPLNHDGLCGICVMSPLYKET